MGTRKNTSGAISSNGWATAASDVDTIRRIAVKLGIPERTLYSAVDRGDIPLVPLAAGTRAISLAAARAWNAGRRKPAGVAK